MKAVPANLMALGVAFLLCAGSLGLLESQPARASSGSLQVSTVAERTAAEQVELTVSWHWDPPAPERGWAVREHLLAVSFDTQALAFEAEEASFGVGAGGDELQRLDRTVGPDGARRLFVIPEQQDGIAHIRFRPVGPEAAGSTRPFRVYVVLRTPGTDIWMKEATIPEPMLPGSMPAPGFPL